MKKILAIAVAASVAALAQAAAVGWSASSVGTSYNGDAYQLFVIGQNGVTSISQITELLDAGTAVSDYAFGNGTVANGRIQQGSSTSGKSLAAGSYTSFFVLYDAASPSSGDSKYVVMSGGANQAQTFDSTAANVTFGAGNVSSIVNNADNWKAFGSSTPPGPDDPTIVPEPTTVALLALGLAAFGLKRKIA